MKLKDLGSFTILIIIVKSVSARGLCDLEASINLMPMSLFKKIGFGSLRHTAMVLELVDRTLARPNGIVEDMSV